MDSSPPITEPQWLSGASELSKLCLPQAYKDSNRRLAWVNSICFLFLLIGAVGFSPPKIYVRPLSEVNDVIPIILAPPEDTPPPPTEQPPDPEPAAEATLDAPVVATVVAADASTVAFAVPVEGPVVLAPTRFAGPPPANPRPPTGNPSKYIPSVGDWGGHPAPEYPGQAIRMGYQGTVTLQITVDASGTVSDVLVKKSSGYKILDDSALHHVRNHLRLRNPPGEMRYHTLDIVFKLQR